MPNTKYQMLMSSWKTDSLLCQIFFLPSRPCKIQQKTKQNKRFLHANDDDDDEDDDFPNFVSLLFIILSRFSLIALRNIKIKTPEKVTFSFPKKKRKKEGCGDLSHVSTGFLSPSPSLASRRYASGGPLSLFFSYMCVYICMMNVWMDECWTRSKCKEYIK